MASSVSVASPAAAAIRSWALTESLRTRLPIARIGRISTGASTNKTSVSFQLAKNIRPSAPSEVTVERTAIEKVEPKKVSISVTSAVRRETASPVRSLAK